jgi:hypothetical protein
VLQADSSSVHPLHPDSSLADHAPSIPLAPVLQALADQALPAVVPASAHGQALEHLAPVASAGLVRAAPLALRLRVRLLVPSVRRTIADAVEASSIRRPKKAR